FARLPEPVSSDTFLSLEDLAQGYGALLYRTTLPPCADTLRLTVTEPHDYAQIFLNDRYIGTLDRRKGENSLLLPPVADSARLDLFVEAMGRINFGRAIKDYKGITERVTLGDKELTGWEIYPMPDSDTFYSSPSYYPLEAFTPGDDGRLPRGIYRATFEVETPGDTFLDFSTWGKGLVYVNGHALGRIWEIGPQQTLYTPGCWLKEGTNEIMVMDILGPRRATVEGLDTPIINKLNDPDRKSRSRSKAPVLGKIAPIASGRFAAGSGWQEVTFRTPATGRYLCIEALDSHDGDQRAAIAELYLLDVQGNRLSREPWKAVYADSEDRTANLTADKTFDLQESTSWTTAEGAPYPHMLMIDLGSQHTVGALQYLPRMETPTPGAIRTYRLYLTP
ncbi:MAG: beta-galactosidase, partial [Duncaniella sp.]|nr:beta-galactosidase [Duncaniella sp.]